MARKVGHLKIKLNGVFEMVTARGTYFKYPLSLNLKVCLSPVCLCGCGQMTGCLISPF
jgi:hypothetical protein